MSEKPPSYSENYGTIPESSPPGGWTAPPPPPSYDNLGKFLFWSSLKHYTVHGENFKQNYKPFQ